MMIFDALKRDHDEIKQLIAKIDSKKDAPDFDERFARLTALVVVHARAEEDTFYAELEEVDGLEERVERAAEEHQAVEALLGELGAGDLASAMWRQRFAEMRDALLRHIREEEGEVFGQARGALQDADLDRIGRAFSAERERLLREVGPIEMRRRA